MEFGSSVAQAGLKHSMNLNPPASVSLALGLHAGTSSAGIECLLGACFLSSATAPTLAAFSYCSERYGLALAPSRLSRRTSDWSGRSRRECGCFVVEFRNTQGKVVRSDC